jgi:hypothetical protein
MMVRQAEIKINLDARCSRCGAKGAAQNGLCLTCTGDDIVKKLRKEGNMSEVKENPSAKLLRTETRNLPCKLTDAELRDKADQLATTVQAIEGEKGRQDSVKAELKATMTELESRQSRLAQVVSRREEYRDVKVIIEWHENDIVQEAREDTGQIIQTRPARDTERQEKMELN